jgi:hypothetical protein
MPKAWVSAKIEAKRFDKKLKQLRKKKNKPLNTELLELTQMYIQSVVPLTPPKKGKKPEQPSLGSRGRRLSSMATKKKRAVIDTTYPDKYRYQVPFRTPWKKGRKYFKTKKEANNFAIIKYRHIGKHGWVMAGRKALGASLKIKKVWVSTWVKRIENSLASVKKWLPDGVYDKPFIWLTNKVRAVARYDGYSTTAALRKVNNRLQHGSKSKKRIKKGYSKLWQLLR